MSKARYAIVRVNFVCPNTYEGISYKFVCQNNGPIKNFQCDKCRYGDTREQLIAKVTQAIDIKLCQDNFNTTNKMLAKFIVEFLGVE